MVEEATKRNKKAKATKTADKDGKNIKKKDKVEKTGDLKIKGDLLCTNCKKTNYTKENCFWLDLSKAPDGMRQYIEAKLKAEKAKNQNKVKTEGFAGLTVTDPDADGIDLGMHKSTIS